MDLNQSMTNARVVLERVLAQQAGLPIEEAALELWTATHVVRTLLKPFVVTAATEAEPDEWEEAAD